jgi:hypothetical protein
MSLNIPPVGPSLPKPGALATPAMESPPPQDRFESLPPAEDADRLRRAARGLVQQDKLGKAETTYLPNAWARGADGTLFIGYGESGRGRRATWRRLILKAGSPGSWPWARTRWPTSG